MERPTTYGGESELLLINRDSGKLVPMSKDMQSCAQDTVSDHLDMRGAPVDVGYDSSTHLIEIGGGVWDSLPGVVTALQNGVIATQQEANRNGDSLLSASHHPVDNIQEAYDNGVLPKGLYDILRGPHNDTLRIHAAVLSTIYPEEPETGRRWKHEVGTMAASAQPWTSLELDTAAEQIAALQATGWMMNLLTANGPYAEGMDTGKRDYRLEMWGPKGIMSTSKHEGDRNLTENIPIQPDSLSTYYNYVWGNQRPMVIPVQQAEGIDSQYKTKFMAVVQPPEAEEFNVLTYLSADSIQAIDIETGEQMNIKPSIAHVVNGFDFLYFPRYGARLRMNLPKADEIDSKEVANAVQQGDEETFKQLLKAGGIEDGGFLCAEGRVAATVLPTEDNPHWNRFNLPFVLQTAIARSHKDVMDVMMNTHALEWKDLAYTLPELTNDAAHGFNATLKNSKGKTVQAADLAAEIWNVASKSLLPEELDLVEDEIEAMVAKRQGPAEEQKEYVMKQLQSESIMAIALLGLVERQSMVLPYKNSNSAQNYNYQYNEQI